MLRGLKKLARALVLLAFAALAFRPGGGEEKAKLPSPAKARGGAGEKYTGNISPLGWAGDELRVRGPGARNALPEARLLEAKSGHALFRLPAPLDRPRFLALVKDVEARPGVKEVRPVFYTAAERHPAYRRELTRQVAVTLKEGMSIEAVAARANARVAEALEGMERTWLLEASTPFGALEIAEALKDDGLPLLEVQYARPPAAAFTPNDTHFGSQWHLLNPVQTGEDLGVTAAWDLTQGSGAVIGIVDDGLDHAHPDLAPAYSAALSTDFNGGDSDPTPAVGEDHGTVCAGLAGARGNNGLGVAGAAPQATLAGLRLTAEPVSDSQVRAAMIWRNDAIHVKSNSWGFPNPPAPTPTIIIRAGPLWKNGVADGATNGRAGRGVVYVWAAGNDLPRNDNANFDEYVSNRHVLAVPALLRDGTQAPYSEWGANLFVSAPGGNLDMVSTSNVGTGDFNADYTDSFSGTSASTPLVAGVAGLLIARRPELKARDVMHLLARGARKNHLADGDWSVNGAGFNVNHKYGLGAVDAAASVVLADQWPLVGPEILASGSSGTINLPILDNPAPAVSSTINVGGTPLKVEAVEVEFLITHTFRGDLRITLVSPAGTQSRLAVPRFDPVDGYGDDGSSVVFLSRRHLGEPSTGAWRLDVEDDVNNDTGTLVFWSIRLYGSAIDSTPPVAGVVNEGAGADVDGQSSTTTVLANWSGFSDPQSGLAYELALGTTPGAEDVVPFSPAGTGTSGSLTGLSLAEGTRYYVSVRARNFDGLISVVSGDGVVPDGQAPNTPAAPGVTPARSSTGQFALSWTAPADPGGSGVVRYDLQRSLNGGAFVDLQTGVTSTSFDADVSGLMPGSYRFQVRAIDAAGNIGPYSAPSATVVFDPQPPAVAINAPGAVSSPLNLSGTASDNLGVTAISWVNLATGLGGSTGGGSPWNLNVALRPGQNVIHVFAWDATGNVGSAQIVVNHAPSDVLPPLLTMSAPASTSTPTLALSGAATDDVGVAAIEWENRTTGTRGPAAGTAPWNASVPLLRGANLIRATARDAAGNSASVEATVSYAPAAVDGTLPSVAITSPNGGAGHSTFSSPIAQSGTASDDVALAAVVWSNAATGGAGTASGTAVWSATFALAPGANAVTVRALDAHGNEATDTQTITFTPAGSDTVDPRVAPLSPSTGSFATTASAVELTGLATDDTAVVEVVWSNALTGQSGTASGTAGWSATIPLAGGSNVIELTAYDAQGNAGTSTLTITQGSGGGGGGGGGCGLTGLEPLLLMLGLRRLRMRAGRRARGGRGGQAFLGGAHGEVEARLN